MISWRSRYAAGHGAPQHAAAVAKEITLLDLFEAVEGPLDDAECLLGKRVCDDADCIVGEFVKSVHEQVRQYLSSTSIGTHGTTVYVGLD